MLEWQTTQGPYWVPIPEGFMMAQGPKLDPSPVWLTAFKMFFISCQQLKNQNISHKILAFWLFQIFHSRPAFPLHNSQLQLNDSHQLQMGNQVPSTPSCWSRSVATSNSVMQILLITKQCLFPISSNSRKSQSCTAMSS